MYIDLYIWSIYYCCMNLNTGNSFPRRLNYHSKMWKFIFKSDWWILLCYTIYNCLRHMISNQSCYPLGLLPTFIFVCMWNTSIRILLYIEVCIKFCTYFLILNLHFFPSNPVYNGSCRRMVTLCLMAKNSISTRTH